MEKNDNQNNGMRRDDDDRSQAGSGGDDDDVFIQAAAIAGDLNNDGVPGKYHVVDESGAVGVRQKNFLTQIIYIYSFFSEKFVIE